MLYQAYTITCSKWYTSVHSSRIVLKNKAVLKSLLSYFRRNWLLAKPNSKLCFPLWYVLRTSSPLALSSLIRNSMSVKGLPDFIYSEYICECIKKKEQLFRLICFWFTSRFFFHDIISSIFWSLVKMVWLFTVTLQIPDMKWKIAICKWAAFDLLPRRVSFPQVVRLWTADQKILQIFKIKQILVKK